MNCKQQQESCLCFVCVIVEIMLVKKRIYGQDIKVARAIRILTPQPYWSAKNLWSTKPAKMCACLPLLALQLAVSCAILVCELQSWLRNNQDESNASSTCALGKRKSNCKRPKYHLGSGLSNASTNDLVCKSQRNIIRVIILAANKIAPSWPMIHSRSSDKCTLEREQNLHRFILLMFMAATQLVSGCAIENEPKWAHLEGGRRQKARYKRLIQAAASMSLITFCRQVASEQASKPNERELKSCLPNGRKIFGWINHQNVVLNCVWCQTPNRIHFPWKARAPSASAYKNARRAHRV